MKLELKYVIVIFFILMAFVAGLVIQDRKIKKVSGERDRYRNNTEVLMSDVEHYRTKDSLDVARVESLELTLREFQKYRAEDAALIKQLRTKNRDLQSVVTTQSEMIVEMSSVPKDTVIIRDSIKMQAKLVHCGDEWYDFDGLITEDSFEGNMISRDSLLVAETVRYKRFLGFLWKTKKVKDRMIDVVSKNPHNVIQDCKLITIEDK